MSLVVIAQPWSESELSVMLCTLQARRIPTFVHGAGFGSLYPGPQIAFYNARRIMVPESFATEAMQALEVFTRQDEPVTFRRPGILNVLRAIFELAFFGWFVPGNRRRLATASNPSSKLTRQKPRAAQLQR
jgi:hypothetical protein